MYIYTYNIHSSWCCFYILLLLVSVVNEDTLPCSVCIAGIYIIAYLFYKRIRTQESTHKQR